MTRARAFSSFWLNAVPQGGGTVALTWDLGRNAFNRWLHAVKPGAVLALTDDVFAWLERAAAARGINARRQFLPNERGMPPSRLR